MEGNKKSLSEESNELMSGIKINIDDKRNEVNTDDEILADNTCSIRLKQNFKDIEKLTVEIDNLDEDDMKLVNIHHFQKKIDDCVTDIYKKNDIIESNKNQADEIMKENSSLKMQLEKYELSIQELSQNKQSYFELQRKLVEMQEQQVPYRNELARLKALNDSLETKCACTLNDYMVAKQHIQDQEIVAAEANMLWQFRLDELEDKLRNTKLTIEALENETKCLELDTLNRKLELEVCAKSEAEFRQYMQAFEQKVDKIKASHDSKIAQLKEQNQFLNNDLKTAVDKLCRCQVDYEKSSSDLQKLRQITHDQSVENASLSAKLGKWEDFRCAQKEEKDKMEAELVERKNQLEELRASRIEDQSVITTSLRNEIQSLREDNIHLLDFKVKNGLLHEQINRLMRTIDEHKIKEENIVSDKSKIMSDFKKSQSNNKSMSKTLEEKDQVIKELKHNSSIEVSVLEKLESKLFSSEEERDDIKQQLDDALVVVADYTKEIDSLKQQLHCSRQNEIDLEKVKAEGLLLQEKCSSTALTLTDQQKMVAQLREELAELSETHVKDKGKLHSEKELLLASAQQMETIISELTSSLTSERAAVSDLESKLISVNADRRSENSTSDKSVQAYFETRTIERGVNQYGLCGIFLKEKLTSWAGESENIGTAFHKCLIEAAEATKLDNVIVPLTYSFETGNEHVTGQISLVFDAFVAVLKKYIDLTNILKTYVKSEENVTVNEDSEDNSNKGQLSKLLNIEFETSSNLCGSVENLKTLVELNVMKIIMQKPAPMLQERQIFNVVCLLTIQLLQYFSLSQKKDRSTPESITTLKDGQSFDFTLINLMPENKIHSDLEFSFDDCGHDSSINSLTVDPEGTKSSLESSLCPHLVKALKGNVDSVDVTLLQQEAKQFETSLEAAIGLVEAQILSNNEKSCLQYVSLREPAIPDNELLISLQQKLFKEEEENDELRKKLHQVQGLLNGARENNSATEEERSRLAECVCKMSIEIQNLTTAREAAVEVHTIHTNEGQDLHKVIRDSRDKVKILLAFKKEKNLATEDLISMNDELECILRKILSESERALEQLVTENVDLSSQLLVAERKICCNKRFIDEQIVERDKEAEQLMKENQILQKALKERDAQEKLSSTLNDEVASLQKDIVSKECTLQSEIAHREELDSKLSVSAKKINELRRTIDQLESQLAVKFVDEDFLRTEISALKDQLVELQQKLNYKQQIENAFESGFEDNYSEGNKCSDDEQSARKSVSPNFGPSAMEELGLGRNIVFETTFGIRLLDGLLEKVEKAVAANINSSRTSISHCSEEDISAKDTINISTTINRTMSPNSWECKLEEKLASFEMHIETLIKQNSDLCMQLQIAKKECEEIGTENEFNIKRLDSIKESLSRDASETQDKWRVRLDEANNEKRELMTKYSANLLKISSLQAIIDEARRIPAIDSKLLNRVSILQSNLTTCESALAVKTAQTSELHYAVAELESKLAQREEDIKKLINAASGKTALPTSNWLQSFNISDDILYCDEVQRRDPGTGNISIVSEIAKSSAVRSSKDSSNIVEETPTLVSKTAAVYLQPMPQLDEKKQIEDIPANKSIASDDSFSLNNELVALENERTKLQDVCTLMEEKNAILIADIKLLTDEKLELEARLERALHESQTNENNILQENSTKRIDEVKAEAKNVVDKLHKKMGNIKKLLEEEKSASASLVKTVCQRDETIRIHKQEICDLTEKHNKDKMDEEQLMIEQFTKQMQNLAESWNKEREAYIQERGEILSKQDRLNVSHGSWNETILNLTMKDLEQLRSKKMLKKVYKEGLAILSLTEGDNVHNSLLDTSVLSDSSGSLEFSRDLSLSGDVARGHNNYKRLCRYLKERIEKLEEDVKAVHRELLVEKMKHVEMLKEKSETHLQFDSLQWQLNEAQETVKVYGSEAENTRQLMAVLQDELFVERSSRRKLLLDLAMEKKTASGSQNMQDNIIKELESTLEKERIQRLELVNNSACHGPWESLYEKSIDNVYNELAENSNDFESDSENKNRNLILIELEESKFKVEELKSRLQSMQLENNLLLSESFRGEEISLRRTVAALQDQVEILQREKVAGKCEKLVAIPEHCREMIAFEKQVTVDLFQKLFESQSDREYLRNVATGQALPSDAITKTNAASIEASTNTDPISYDDELKMYLMYSQQGRDHNRIFLWNLIQSRQQCMNHQKALIAQKIYLIRCLQDCAAQEKLLQGKITTLADRAFQSGYKIARGTQTACPRSPIKHFRVVAYAVITVIRMRILKNVSGRKIHDEYYRLLKAIRSDEIVELNSIDRQSVSGSGLPHFVSPRTAGFTTHTPPTKDVQFSSSNSGGAYRRNLFNAEDVIRTTLEAKSNRHINDA